MVIVVLTLGIGVSYNHAFGGVNTSDKDGDGYYHDPPVGMERDPDDNDPCVPDKKTTACRGTVIQEINDVIGDITDYIEAGNFNINSGQAQSLITKLENALAKIESGKYNGAIGSLEAFINQINSFINSKKIPYDEGQNLIKEVKRVIDILKGY